MIADIALAAGASVILVLAGFGLGGFVLRSRRVMPPGLESVALQLLAGFGLLGVCLFLIGSWRWNRIIAASILLPLAFAGVRRLLRSRIRLSLGKVKYYAVPIAMLGLCCLAGLSRPTGDIGNDAISYHLMGPEKWAEASRIAPVLDHSHTAFPATIEVLFGAGMLLSNDRLPGLFDVCFAAILLVLIRGLVLTLFPRERAAVLATTLAAAMPVVMMFADNGFIDVAYACFCLAAVRVALDSTMGAGPFAIGMFSGFAVGTKYTGLVFLVIMATLMIAFPNPRLPWQWGRLRSPFLAILTALAISSPWYLRNWLILGSPVYPIPLAMQHVFRSPYFPASAISSFNAYILERGKGFGRAPRWLFALPFTFTYFTEYFHGAGGIGLGPLCFGPAGCFILFRFRAARFLLTVLVLASLAWFYTQQEARFLLPAVAIGSVFAGVGGCALLWQRSFAGRIVSWAVVVTSLFYGGAVIVGAKIPAIRSLLGASAESRRLSSTIPFYAAFQFLNQTPSVARVLIVSPIVPVYYLRKAYIKPAGPYGEVPVPGLNVSGAVSQAIPLGVTHILEVQGGGFGVQFQVPPSSELRLVFSEGDARVYQVVPTTRLK